MKKAYIQPEFEKLTLKSAHDFLNASLEQGAAGNTTMDDVADNGNQDYNAPASNTPASKWE